jgi:hypothetical protein
MCFALQDNIKDTQQQLSAVFVDIMNDTFSFTCVCLLFCLGQLLKFLLCLFHIIFTSHVSQKLRTGISCFCQKVTSSGFNPLDSSVRISQL